MQLSRAGQLRALQVIQRMRLPRAAELLRYLLPLGYDATVQDSVRLAGDHAIDFERIEDWLESYLLLDDSFMRRVLPAVPLQHRLGRTASPEESPRVQRLIHSRTQSV